MKKQTTNGYTEIFAHRGYRVVAPENTFPAFEAALAYDIDGLEIDVHRTLDGELVIMHDETVDRTTNGTGFIKDMTLNDIKALDAGIYKEPKFPGTTVPTLREFLTFLREKNFTGKLLIEVKTDHVAYDGIEAQILAMVTSFEPTYEVLYQSFNLATLREFRKLDKTLSLAALVSWATPRVYWRRFLGDFTYLHPNIKALEMRPRYFWSAGRHLRPWTVDKDNQLEHVFAQTLPGVITNEVAKAVAIREKIQGDGQ
ncbi:MAG TPA: glycerophosphodiester phosphodiesterase family protein [Lactobacillaceae bacterium]|jgi:glycerophosphoryl diester phosphodiesterase